MTPVQLFNLALLKIGDSKGVVTLTDATRAAWTGAQAYDHILRATLRSHPWAFATKYLALTAVQGPIDWEEPLVQAYDAAVTYPIGDVVSYNGEIYYVIVQTIGNLPTDTDFWTTTATEEANGDWSYAYRWPSDCLFARRFVSPSKSGREYDANPIKWRKGRDINGLLLYSNEPAAILEYTMIDCENLWTDDLFLKAFTWNLAAEIAPSLSRDEKMPSKCVAMFEHTLHLAQVMDAREQQQAKEGDPDWIADRG